MMPDRRPGPVGIDVVDCFEKRMRGKADDSRFVARVFTDRETDQIRNAADPDLVLWMMWAAKEAVFKAETVAEGEPPVFDHSAFEVTVPISALALPYPNQTDAPAWRPDAAGHVLRRGVECPVEWSLTGSVVCLAPPHTAPGIRERIGVERLSDVASGSDTSGNLEALIEAHFHPTESRAMHSLPSGLVRLAARTAAVQLLQIEADRLRIVTPPGPAGRTPPHLEVDGKRDPRLALSISHHGDRIAWIVRAG